MYLFSAKRKNSGFSMIEIIMVIVISAILIGAVAANYKSSATSGRVASTLQSIDQINLAAQSYMADNSSFTGVSVSALAQNGKYLPAGFVGTGTNAFGGDFSIAPNASNNTQAILTLTRVDSASATKLQNALRMKTEATSYNNGTQTLTVTF